MGNENMCGQSEQACDKRPERLNLAMNAANAENAERAESADGGGTATATRPSIAPRRVDRMPLWKVLLHNDQKNEMGYVVEAILELTSLNPQTALIRMLEAHKSGTALLVATHREHAELLQEQFASKGLQTTIEPDH